jgi:phage gp29-like protein
MSNKPTKAPTTPKRKYLSGAQKRKLRAEREAAAHLSHAIEKYEAATGGVPLAFSARPSSQELTELPVYGVAPPKYVGAVEVILRDLEAGNFHTAAQLADAMMRDDRIHATLGVRVNGLLGSRLDMEPAMDTSRARRIQEDAEEILSEVMPLPEVSELLRWGLLLGVGIAQVIYTRDGKSWCPTLKVWHPRFLRFDWTTRQFKLLTQNQGEIVVDRDDPNWIVFEPYGARGWLRCLMRALVMPWLIRSWTRSWWARYAEVHGQPIRAGVIPSERDPGDEKRFLSQLQNLGHEASIRLPQGADGNKFDVKLVEAVGRSTETFQGLLAHCDDSIAITILGQRTSTSGASGLGSDANPGDAVRIDLKRSDALIGDVLRSGLWKSWARFNYGAEDLAPYIRWQVDPPEDLQKKAQELLTLMQALQIAPPDLDKRATMESFNLALIDEADMPPDVPGTPDPKPQTKTDDSNEQTAENELDSNEQATPAEVKAKAQEKLSARVDKLTAAAKEGDAYSLALAANAKRLAARALGPDLQKVKAVIEGSSNPAELRENLKHAFSAMDPEQLADVTHKALVLGKLAGMAAAHTDTKRKK